jgi:hypothetical protein
MVVVAIAAVAAGAFGPIYRGEADQSVLLSTLRAAPAGNDGLTLLPRAGPGAATRLVRASDAVSGAFGGRTLFGPAIVTEDLGVTTTSRTTGQHYGSDLVARSGVCRHLAFTTGGCPVSSGSVAVSTRSARELGLRPGDRLTLSATGTARPIVLTISGLFRPGDPGAAFWWGENVFGAGFGTPTLPTLDDFFADAQTVAAVAPPGRVALMTQRPLVADALTPGDVGPFETALSAFAHRTGAVDGVGVSSGVDRLLADAAGAEQTTGTIVIVVDLQLVLLALLVLYFVAARTAEVRRPDVRLAELRGFGRTDATAVALLEPLTVLGAAVPVGIVVAWVAALVATAHLFAPGVSPGVGFLAVGAALLCFAGGVVSTVLGARHLILGRRPGSPEGPGPTAVAVAVDAVAVTLAGAAFVEVAVAGVSSGSHTDPLAAFAPGLLAFGVGVLCARLLPVAARVAIGGTRDSRWAGATVAVRRVARRPELSRQVVLLSSAVGLATFAVAGWSIAGHNRTLRGDFDVGAARVLTVQVRPGVDFLTAVRDADPGGKEAMAAVIERAPDGLVLAVDARRLAAVGAWPSTLSPLPVGTIAHLIAPPTAPTVTISGQALRVSVDVARDVDPAPQLEAVVFDNGFQSPTTLDLGSLDRARRTYQASLAGDCAGSCRLVGLGLAWAPAGTTPTETLAFPIRVTALSERRAGGSWVPVPAGLRVRGHWSGSTGVGVGPTPTGLAVHATVDADGAPATFGPEDVPEPLPAVVTTPGTATVGLDGATIAMRAVADVSALPVIGNGNGATMVDLPLAERLQSGPMTDATTEVWLSPAAGPSVVGRLERAGMAVVSVRTVAARVAVLSKTGVSLAYVLFLLGAVVAAVLAAGATVFTVSVTARRRTVEWASLRAVGVGRGTLLRSLALEQALVLGVGVVAGAGAGILATAVALPSVPEVFAPGPGPPLAFPLPWAAMGVIVAAVVAALVVTVTVAGRLVVDRASAEKLGGEQ